MSESLHLRVQGELAGIEDYVLRDTPAAGAARRLRARAFRVHAYSHLIAREAARRTGLAIVSEGGGKFALEGQANDDVERSVNAYQAEIDQWSLAELRGELVCHLAVDSKMELRRGRPLEGALVNGARWNAAAFSAGWNDPDAIQCPSCAGTATNSGDGFCMTCAEDDAGAAVTLAPSKVLGDADGVEWPASARKMPSGDFLDLARKSPGQRKLLAYLAVSSCPAGIDCGDTFMLDLPQGTLLIGAWDEVLRLALALREKVEGDFSAGISLADPHSSMRASAQAARTQLARATDGRCSLFGEILDWKSAAEVAERGFEMAGWLKEDRIDGTGSRRRTIRRIAELHRLSRLTSQPGENGWRLRYLPLLIWESRDADKMLRRRIMRLAADRAQWETTGLVTELAFLAAKG